MTKLQFADLDLAIKASIVEHVGSYHASNHVLARCSVLITHMVKQILRPSDLKSLCLVNHQLRGLAVKPLYREVNVDVGGPNDGRLTDLCSPRNIGLQHVRCVRLQLANVDDKCNQIQQANLAVKILLDFLPEDSLEDFSWGPWEAFSADNLLLLHRKQRKMKWVEVMELDRIILPELRQNDKLHTGLLSHARNLSLYPPDPSTLDMCQFFVEKMADALEKLQIDVNFGPQSPGDRTPPTTTLSDVRTIHDSVSGPGLLTGTIFSHMRPFDKCIPFKNLRMLSLHRVHLRYSADTWCRFVDFHQIESLKLYQCPGVESMIGQLSKAAHLPKRLRTFRIQHNDNLDSEALTALDGFLCLVSGLSTLLIDFTFTKHLPASAGIVRHCKTLESLMVHCAPDADSDSDELVWDVKDFEKIAQACTKLEQLSCAWPSTSLIRSPSTKWQAYETAAFGSLTRLVTLHLSTFPSTYPSKYLPRPTYETLLQALATRLFRLARKGPESQLDEAHPTEVRYSKLNLIAFGNSEKVYQREDTKNQMCYLRSTCTSALGETKVSAAPIGWCLRQFLEPRSDVLDLIPMLGRETRMVPWSTSSEFTDEDEADRWND